MMVDRSTSMVVTISAAAVSAGISVLATRGLGAGAGIFQYGGAAGVEDHRVEVGPISRGWFGRALS
jgi:hypothetical protein